MQEAPLAPAESGRTDANRFPPRIKSGQAFACRRSGARKATNPARLVHCPPPLAFEPPAQDQPNHNITRVIYSSGGAGARFPRWWRSGTTRREDAAFSRSILVIIIVGAVVASLIGRMMRCAALIVPQPSIHAVGGEQLRVRAALDRLAA